MVFPQQMPSLQLPQVLFRFPHNSFTVSVCLLRRLLENDCPTKFHKIFLEFLRKTKILLYTLDDCLRASHGRYNC